MTQKRELLFEEIFFETFVKSDGFQIAFFEQLDIIRGAFETEFPPRGWSRTTAGKK